MSEELVRVRALLFAVLLAVVGVAVFRTDADARWKYGASGCEWSDESSPDQCDPNEPPPAMGRYKTDGTRCWWEATDSGPNQCDPNLPTGEAPQATEDTVPQFEVELTPEADPPNFGLEAVAPVPSCRAYTKRGQVGYISVQVNPFDGSLAWGAYMTNAQLNFGWWTATVYVNGHREDITPGQPYPPHASLPAWKVPAGSMVSINVSNRFYQWVIVPMYIPEFGWVWTGEWIAGRASGSLQCVMPLAGSDGKIAGCRG